MKTSKDMLKEYKELKEKQQQYESFIEVGQNSAHEINDKLAVILGAAETLWEVIDKKDFYCTQQIETIIRAVDRITILTNEIEKSSKKPKSKLDKKATIMDSEKTHRILLAEDDRDNRNILKVMMNRIGVDVKIASDGKEALEIFNRFHFDMVITDVKMPKLDGIGLLKEIREVKPNMPVVLITGFDKESSMKLAEDEENLYFLRKPFRQKQLLDTINKILKNNN